MLTLWLSTIGDIHCSFRGSNKEHHCWSLLLQTGRNAHSSKTRMTLLNRRDPILLQDNARPYVSKMTLRNLIDLELDTLPHPTNFSDLSPSDWPFFHHLDNVLSQKTFRCKDVENALKNFLAIEHFNVAYTDRINIVVQWQKWVTILSDLNIFFNRLRAQRNTRLGDFVAFDSRLTRQKIFSHAVISFYDRLIAYKATAQSLFCYWTHCWV